MIKHFNRLYSSLSLLKPRKARSNHAETLCLSSLFQKSPVSYSSKHNSNYIANSPNIAYTSTFNFGTAPKRSPFRPKSTWPLQNFASFADYLTFLQTKPDLEMFLTNEENAQRVVNSFWQLLENTNKDSGKTIDTNAIKAFALLYKEQLIPLTEFPRLEEAFLRPEKLGTLTAHDYSELLLPFINHNIGATEFYKILSDSFLEKVKQDMPQKDFLKVLAHFTKANAYSDAFRDFTIEYLKSLISSHKHSTKPLTAPVLGPIAFFMALEYDKTKFLHEEFYKVITDMLKERKADFYQTIKKIEDLRFIWNMLQSTQIYDKELFDKLSKEGQILKKMPFIMKGTAASEGQKEVFEELLKVVEKNKETAMEKRIGVYFVDIFVGPDTVIEVNSFRHYFDFGTRRSGAYEIKYRNLNGMGYKIKELDLKNWYDVPEEEKGTFLKRYLENAV